MTEAKARPKGLIDVEVLYALAGTQRVVCRDGDGALYLASLEGGGVVKLISPKVELEPTLRLAQQVLAGDARALTWGPASIVLALALLSITEPAEPSGEASASAGETPAGSTPPRPAGETLP